MFLFRLKFEFTFFVLERLAMENNKRYYYTDIQKSIPDQPLGQGRVLREAKRLQQFTGIDLQSYQAGSWTQRRQPSEPLCCGPPSLPRTLIMNARMYISGNNPNSSTIFVGIDVGTESETTLSNLHSSLHKEISICQDLMGNLVYETYCNCKWTVMFASIHFTFTDVAI